LEKNLENLQMQLNQFQKKYSKYLEEKERIRKRQQDIHFTKKDKEILIESFVIGGVIENLVTRLFSKLL